MVRYREFRNKLGLSQKDVADRVGVSKAYISLIEKGDRIPSVSILEHLALVLHTCPGKLMDFPCPHCEQDSAPWGKIDYYIKLLPLVFCSIFLFEEFL